MRDEVLRTKSEELSTLNGLATQLKARGLEPAAIVEREMRQVARRLGETHG